jgi:hypothetical protein
MGRERILTLRWSIVPDGATDLEGKEERTGGERGGE